MEENMPSPVKSSLNYGLYIGLALVLASLTYYLSGNTFAKSSNWVSYLIMVTGIVMAQLNYRKNLGGIMTYGQALGIGVLTMLFASVILSAFTYILYKLIDPSLTDQMRMAIEEELVNEGNLPEDQIAKTIDLLSRLQTPTIMAFTGIVSGTFTGLIISLITSIITQKKSIL